ncbi:hypothetical protein MASR2M15_12280 [Anaerolineales bacterium]
MASNSNSQKQLQQAIDAIRNDQKAEARLILRDILQKDPHNESAWLWLASAVNSIEDRRNCLQQVLRINPANARSRQALSASEAAGGVSASANRSPVRPVMGSSNILSIALRVGFVILVIMILVFIFTQSATPEPPPPPTLSVAQLARTPSPTPTLTATPPFIIVKTRDIPTLEPTWTATVTETPLPSPSPTLTTVPIGNFSSFITQREQDDGNYHLYYLDASGEMTKLIDNVRSFDIAKDGQKIVFSPDSDDETVQSQLYITTLGNPGEISQVTNLERGFAHSPVFSADGNQILFVSDFDGDEEIYLLDLNSGITSQLTYNEVSDRDPAWSPDQTMIAFSSDRDSPGLTEIYRLIFVEDPPEIPEEVQVHDSGHIVERLTNDQGSSYSPSWSPDSKKIVFASDREGDGDIYIMDADGNRPRQLTVGDSAEDRLPVFTPEGSMIAFVSNRIDDRFQFFSIQSTGHDLSPLIENNQSAGKILFDPQS